MNFGTIYQVQKKDKFVSQARVLKIPKIITSENYLNDIWIRQKLR